MLPAWRAVFTRRSHAVAVPPRREARDTMVITRPVCERLFDTAFRLADERRQRGGRDGAAALTRAVIARLVLLSHKVAVCSGFPG
jgi:hypothetical protein